jgi:carbamoyl-phosphate synthase small subunit
MLSLLVLQDGTVFEGQAIGAPGTVLGEVVFSTSMTGYQEMLTDPSYAGQLLTLTYPLIGNYGVTDDDLESRGVQVNGFIIKQLCDVPSNWRSAGGLQAFLERHGVTGIQGIDTRALTRRLRVEGVMMGLVTSELSVAEALDRLREAPSYEAVNYVHQVTTPEPYVWEPTATREDGRVLEVSLVDCGVKYNILRSMAEFGVRTTVFPCTTSAEEILERRPDGIAFSPGPGDPKHLEEVVATARKLVHTGIPTFGICLGNQIVGKAFGADTFKLPFGHRGGNHPVKDLETERVYITSQNHGYAVDPKALEASGLEVSHVNLNDGTVEGLRHKELPVFTIQYHPEANPGPRDSAYLFNRFVAAIEER